MIVAIHYKSLQTAHGSWTSSSFPFSGLGFCITPEGTKYWAEPWDWDEYSSSAIGDCYHLYLRLQTIFNVYGKGGTSYCAWHITIVTIHRCQNKGFAAPMPPPLNRGRSNIVSPNVDFHSLQSFLTLINLPPGGLTTCYVITLLNYSSTAIIANPVTSP